LPSSKALKRRFKTCSKKTFPHKYISANIMIDGLYRSICCSVNAVNWSDIPLDQAILRSGYSYKNIPKEENSKPKKELTETVL
jgi:hypothetical protein